VTARVRRAWIKHQVQVSGQFGGREEATSKERPTIPAYWIQTAFNNQSLVDRQRVKAARNEAAKWSLAAASLSV